MSGASLFVNVFSVVVVERCLLSSSHHSQVSFCQVQIERTKKFSPAPFDEAADGHIGFPTRIKAVIFWLQERLFQRVMFNPSAKLSVPGLQLPFHMWGDIFYFFLNRLYLHQKGFLEFRQWRQDQQVKQDKNSKVTSLQTSHGNISTVCVL